MLLGYHEGNDDIVSYIPTDNIFSSSASDLVLSHNEVVHVTVTCINKLNFRSTNYSEPVTVLTNPPSTEDAFVKAIPHQYSYFLPRDFSQVHDMDVAFMLGGFGDNATIKHYEYMMQSSDKKTEWISIGKQVISEQKHNWQQCMFHTLTDYQQ